VKEKQVTEHKDLEKQGEESQKVLAKENKDALDKYEAIFKKEEDDFDLNFSKYEGEHTTMRLN